MRVTAIVMVAVTYVGPAVFFADEVAHAAPIPFQPTIMPDSIPLDGTRAIVKLDAKRPTQVPAFNQAQATIRQQLEAQALEKASAQLVGGLLKNATIQQ